MHSRIPCLCETFKGYENRICVFSTCTVHNNLRSNTGFYKSGKKFSCYRKPQMRFISWYKRVTRGCTRATFDWNIASSDIETFTVFLVFLFPIIQCDISCTCNTQIKKNAKSGTALFAIKCETLISCWTQVLNWYFATIIFIIKDLTEFLFCRMERQVAG